MSTFTEYDPHATSDVSDGTDNDGQVSSFHIPHEETILKTVFGLVCASFIALLVWGGVHVAQQNRNDDQAFRAWCTQSGGTIETDYARVPVPDRLSTSARVGYCMANGERPMKCQHPLGCTREGAYRLTANNGIHSRRGCLEHVVITLQRANHSLDLTEFTVECFPTPSKTVNGREFLQEWADSQDEKWCSRCLMFGMYCEEGSLDCLDPLYGYLTDCETCVGVVD